MCLNTGTPKNINFSFETNGKLMALGVPILKHFRVLALFWLHNDRFYTATFILMCPATCATALSPRLTLSILSTPKCCMGGMVKRTTFTSKNKLSVNG